MADQQGLVRAERGTGDAVASGVDDLTATYLTAALRPSMPGADVTGVRAERIGTGQIGASSRLHLVGHGVPATLVAKLAADDPASRERVKDGYRKEVRFYRELGERVAGHVPGCWHAAIADDASTFTLLFDDLAPAVPGVQANGCTVAEAAAAVRNLAGIHAATWCDHALLASRWLQAWEPDTGRFLGDVLVGAIDEFVARYGDALGPDDVDTIRRAAGAWAAAPVSRFTVVHGDYRLDNLMFSPDGTVTALDWQTATVGSPMRDLAYFLETSLDVELRRRHEQDLLGTYADALVEGGVDRSEAEESLQQYPDDLRQGPLITVLGAVYATAARSDAADGMFLAMARRSCAALRDHGVLDGEAAKHG